MELGKLFHRTCDSVIWSISGLSTPVSGVTDEQKWQMFVTSKAEWTGDNSLYLINQKQSAAQKSVVETRNYLETIGAMWPALCLRGEELSPAASSLTVLICFFI